MSRWVKHTWAALAAVALTAGLAGCGDKKEDADAQDASRATLGETEAFALAGCKARLFDGAPAVAVMFTQPLARSQDFDKLFKAREGTEGQQPAEAKPVESRWVLGDNPRVLYLPYVTPARQYHVELAADVAAAGGAKLATAQTCTVASEAMPESFYFASRGVVLPAGQNGGLPVVTVNTPEVDVQFLRVDPKGLPEFLERVTPRPRGGEDGDEDEDHYRYYDPSTRLKGTVGGYQLDELRGLAESVYLSRFKTDARTNRRNVSFLPVEKIKELQEPGIYVAIMNAPGRFGWDWQVTYFYVTDIGLHLRRHAGQIDVFATSLKSGKAMGGIEVSLIDEAGKVLAQAKTDGDGHAVFEGLAGRMDKARAVLARRDKEVSVLALRDPALDLSEFDVAGAPSRDQALFVYAGRDLYRPGEQFNVSILARDVDGRPLPQPAGKAALPLTLVLKKPDGEAFSTQLVRPQAVGTGYYQQALSLPATAPTGRWLLELRTDPGAKRADAQWAFQVEEFLPERMKLLLTAPEVALQDGDALDVQVEGNYLYGAPAAGNRLLASVAVERQRIALPQKWPGFVFGDADDDNQRKRQDLEEKTLDDTGKTEVSVPVLTEDRHSPMRVRASFSLLESGGRPVVRSIERTWWPAPVLVGLRPLFDRDVVQEGGLAEFEVVRVDSTGAFKPAKDVQLKLIHEERNWYWRYDDSRGWHSGYTTEEELAEARSLKLTARSKIAVPVRWGRYRLELHDPETGETARYRFYAGWGAQDADDVGNRPDRVQLKLEGAPFKPGDTARLTLTPPHDGQALVTVEGDRVLYQKRLSVSTKGTKLEIPVDAAWARHDLYITVAAFRPGSDGDRVTPARALGLVHLPLAREPRKLKLALTAPPKATPEGRVPVKLKLMDAAGQPLKAGSAIVTLSTVDVGILNITRYATPDPFGFWFGRHRYGADVLDLYGKLIEKMEGNQAKQRFGGDAGKRDTQSLPRKIRLVDLFSGPVQVDARGEATVPLDLPDFNGTLRLMAVASSADSYASTEAEMVVAAPLVAELSLPRFIAPGDHATLALDVTNLSGSPQEVSVQAEAGAPLRLSGSPAPFKLADKQRRILHLAAEATDAYGLAPIKLAVHAGKIQVKREAALQVQPATPLLRSVQRQRLAPGAGFKLPATLLDGLWADSAAVDVVLSSAPPIDVRQAVEGLLMYPYGCLEQTTSSAYPLVFVDEEGARAVGLKPISRDERARRLDGAFARIGGMQQPQGGFGLWSAQGPYEGWLSAYVAGFLQDARDAGFAVPETLRERTMQGLLEQFQRAPGLQIKPPEGAQRDAEGRLQRRGDVELFRQAHQRLAESAHVGYILAREQKAPLATLRTLHDQYRGNARSPLALVHLGLALKLMGDEARARVAFDDAMKLGYGIQPARSDGYGWGEWLGDYGSEVRDTALAYALLHRHQVAHAQRENLLARLGERAGNRQYYSTQERLALFLAARAAGGSKEQPWRATLKRGETTQKLEGKATAQHSLGLAALRAGAELTNTGDEALFIEVTASGYPVKPPAPRTDAIHIERSWWTMDGKPADLGGTLQTGDMLVVRLRVQAKQRIADGLIVDRIPAGLEIENLNISQGPQAEAFAIEGRNVGAAMEARHVKHVEYRDDRFVVASELDGSWREFFYLVRAVTPGRYVVPAPFVEDMYRPELRGIGAAQADLTVRDPRGGAE